jgi:hypothetical protein
MKNEIQQGQDNEVYFAMVPKCDEMGHNPSNEQDIQAVWIENTSQELIQLHIQGHRQLRLEEVLVVHGLGLQMVCIFREGRCER